LQQLPVDLYDTDIAILKSLMEDGRKSLRVVSRQIKVRTPTVKSRYEHFVNIGPIKSVKPEIDLSKVNRRTKNQFFGGEETIKQLEQQKKHFHVKVEENNVKVKMQCENCGGGPIHAKPKVLEFANFQIFSCCIGCKTTIRKSMKAGYCP
jgi:DNA-binding Lrp family transcriptional regulator